MPTFPLTAINVDSFNLGEADKVITLFSKERGLTKGVAKGARKPKSKISGKAEVLCVNSLFLAKGKSLDIITQAQSIETFAALRLDLRRLTYGLYFAELTKAFGRGLEDDSEDFYKILFNYLHLLCDSKTDPTMLGLEFEFTLLSCLGLQPELKVCIICRQALTEYTISAFVNDMGGICCQSCSKTHCRSGSHQVKEGNDNLLFDQKGEDYPKVGTYVTPLVWKYLSKAANNSERTLIEDFGTINQIEKNLTDSQNRGMAQAKNVIQKYLEDKAGRKMKSLDLLKSL